jgi:hypothetical protein
MIFLFAANKYSQGNNTFLIRATFHIFETFFVMYAAKIVQNVKFLRETRKLLRYILRFHGKK